MVDSDDSACRLDIVRRLGYVIGGDGLDCQKHPAEYSLHRGDVWRRERGRLGRALPFMECV